MICVPSSSNKMCSIGSSQASIEQPVLKRASVPFAGGMPDLLLWHPGRNEAKLSEVKGPRDTLSMQQRAWLNALSAVGLQAEVFKVIEPGSRIMKGRKQSK